MHRTRLVVPSLVLLLVLGCPASKGNIDPGTAKRDDLIGYWIFWDPSAADGGVAQGQANTILGFEKNVDARWVLPLAENTLDAGTSDIGVVYEAPPYYQQQLKQVTSFEVKSGAILQTVLADENALPGQQYSTKILELAPKQSMVLESKRDASGKRAYEWFERCPAPNPAGWNTYQGQACTSYFSLGTAVVFDRYGDVHSVSGQGKTILPCQVPTWADITRTCVSRISESPNFYIASLAVGADDVIRMVYTEQQAFALHYRERPVKGDTWSADTVIDPMTGSIYDMKLYDDANGRMIIARTNLGATLYKYDGTGWKKTVGAYTDGGAIPYDFTAFERDSDGKALLTLALAPHVVKETAAGFVPYPVPAVGSEAIAAVKVDSKGRLHAWIGGSVVSSAGTNAGNLGSYGIAENGVWKLWPLPIHSKAWLIPKADGTGRAIVSLGKSGKPAFVMVTVNGDSLDQELLDSVPSGGGTSQEPHIRTAVETGPNDAVAVSFDGQQVWVRWPTGPVHPLAAKVKLLFKGKTGVRVRSTDGKIDCTTDCEVPYPGGSRVEVRLEPSPGYAGVITSCDMQLLNSDRCHLNVLAPVNEVVVEITRTPIRRTQYPGGVTNGSAVGDRFGILGNLTAYGSVMNAGGTFTVDQVALPLANPSARQGIAVFDRTKKKGWHTELPVEADAVMPAADGGAWAIVHVSMPTAFGSTMVGAVGKVTVARLRFDPAGTLTGATTMASVASASTVMGGLLPAAFVQADGAGAEVLVSPSGFGAVTDQTALAHIDAAGTAKLVGIEASAAGVGTMIMEGGRALIGLGYAAKLIAVDASGQVTGRRSFKAGSIKAVTLRGTRFGMLLIGTMPTDAIDLGGGARMGSSFVAEYDASLAHVADATLAQSINALGFAFLPEGGAMLLDWQRVYKMGAGLSLTPPGDTFGVQLMANSTAAVQDENGLSALLSFNTLVSFVPPP